MLCVSSTVSTWTRGTWTCATCRGDIRATRPTVRPTRWCRCRPRPDRNPRGPTSCTCRVLRRTAKRRTAVTTTGRKIGPGTIVARSVRPKNRCGPPFFRQHRRRVNIIIKYNDETIFLFFPPRFVEKLHFPPASVLPQKQTRVSLRFSLRFETRDPQQESEKQKSEISELLFLYAYFKNNTFNLLSDDNVF